MKINRCFFGIFVVLLTLIGVIHASGADCECKEIGKNTFLGIDAGKHNKSDRTDNTFLGFKSGYYNVAGMQNTFTGVEAGYNSKANCNTFTGFRSGYSNSKGYYNTFIGCKAGYYSTEGSNNTFLGFEAGFNNKEGTGNVYIGYRAGNHEKGSNKLFIANSDGNENLLICGDFATKKIGIAKTNPEYALDLGGDGIIRGNLICPSDLRFKEDVRPIENALDKITNLQGVSFRWKDKTDDTGEQLGVIGQEIEKVFPEVVSTDNKGYKSVGYSNLVAPLIEAVKELKAENDKLKARLENLEKKMKD